MIRRKFKFLIFQNTNGYIWIEKVDEGFLEQLDKRRLKLANLTVSCYFETRKKAKEKVIELVKEQEYFLNLTREGIK